MSNVSKAYGTLERVIDGDTAVIRFTSFSKKNQYDIGHRETIRLRRNSAPELGERGSKQAKKALFDRLNGVRIEASIYARDCYTRLVGDLEPATPFYGRAR